MISYLLLAALSVLSLALFNRGTAFIQSAERNKKKIVAFNMAESGLDPRDQEQAFWAEVNQYLAYTYLRFKQARRKPTDL